MKTITLRNLPAHIARLIHRKAAEEGLSLNRAVIRTLEEALGPRRAAPEVLYHDLDDLAGCWSPHEAAGFEQAMTAQRGIDPEVWR